MKRFYTLLAGVIIMGLSAYSTPCLNVKGSIKHNLNSVEQANVTVIKNGKIDTILNSNEKGKFEIGLDQNNEYNLIVSKDGFLSQNLLFDTRFQNPDSYKWEYKFAVNLFPIVNAVDTNFLLEPIAVISYNEEIDEFENMYHESKNILPNKQLSLYKNLLSQDYKQVIQQADSAFLIDNFTIAKQLYTKAALMDESQTYADMQLDLIKRIEAQQQRLQIKYNKYIEMADQYLVNNEPDKAFKYYKKACDIKKSDYIKQQIQKIENHSCDEITLTSR